MPKRSVIRLDEMRGVMAHSAVAFRLPLDAAKHSKHRRAMLARAAVIGLLIQYKLATLSDLARVLGKRDHTTIIHHRDLHEHRLASEAEYADGFGHLTNRVRDDVALGIYFQAKEEAQA